MRDALLDLLLGSSCAVCGLPGRALCPTCRGALPREPFECRPTPSPPGLARPTAVGEYAGPLKALVNAHKEQGRFALARPLGDLLAASVLAHLEGGTARLPPEGAAPQPVVVVPVPSRSAVVRRRGHDPLLRAAVCGAGRLRALGVPAVVLRILRPARTVQDQAGLGAEERARNLDGSLTCGRPPARVTASRVIVVDDVITTGATVREAQRALEEAGIAVHGIATVAATRRRSGPFRADGGPDYRFRAGPTSV